MMLIDDFKTKYPRMWSVWLGALSMLMSLIEVATTVLPTFDGVLKPGTFAVLSATFALLGLVARAIKQFWPEGEGVNGNQ